MLKFLSKVLCSKPEDRSIEDMTVEEITDILRKKSDWEIMGRLRFRDAWIRNWCMKNPYAKVPSSFLKQFAALDRVAAERMIKLMNQIRQHRELPEIDLHKLEQDLVDCYPEPLK